MRIASIAVALPMVLLGQNGPDLDVIPLNGVNCPLQGDAKGPNVKDLNRLKGR
jgi:hypothetical protein